MWVEVPLLDPASARCGEFCGYLQGLGAAPLDRLWPQFLFSGPVRCLSGSRPFFFPNSLASITAWGSNPVTFYWVLRGSYQSPHHTDLFLPIRITSIWHMLTRASMPHPPVCQVPSTNFFTSSPVNLHIYPRMKDKIQFLLVCSLKTANGCLKSP